MPFVWGTGTFHESAARSPNRAETVRAHNGVVMGDLQPGRPWRYLPHSARLYFRESQLPVGESFTTKTGLALNMLQQVDEVSEAPLLAVFDGAYAMQTVIRPCLQNGQTDGRRIDFVTRLRRDARLYRPLDKTSPGPRGGRPRQGGQRLPAPQDHGQWKNAHWQSGRAFLDGQQRRFRDQRIECCWSVSGSTERIAASVFEVDGDRKPWFLVTSATKLSPSQGVAVFAGRFRQEDGFRDHKQRLGMQECRAWTKSPLLRTFPTQMIAQTLLRLLEHHLTHAPSSALWWAPPEWNPHQSQPSLLDTRRLRWRHRTRFSQLLRQRDDMEKPPQTKHPRSQPQNKAA